ncbi:right-handed parallel beta-helix repeat-containing protein [Amycolatopsis anabasis]|uniref:right-handed parallel beta-helix repeat-containing protein n=1 Tax=Amycolatopsis anabasis TaxID=1840409 RepID=UPI00131C6671|nr:right-handed parallel beta-helix repeat-containing protein [Amycolatopsis anabasis]
MRIGSALVGVLLAVTSCVGVGTAQAADVCTVYMAPTGSDGASGLTPAAAVRSLVRVQEVLRDAKPATDVEVRIEQGTYVAPPMQDWRFYVPGHTISFLPIDYEYGEGEDGIAGRPVFRNLAGKPAGFWLQPRLPKDPADPRYDGGDSGLRFYYLQVEHYSSGAVSVFGDSERDITDENHDPPMRRRGSKGLNGNTFFGMVFTQLGSKWAPCGATCYGWGAIVLTNSSNNKIANNHFVNVENHGNYGGHIHGLYVTHFSSGNTMNANRFSFINGDPVKIRDRSNFNTVESNTFTRTGRAGFYRDEFCDLACVKEHPEVGSRQCASYHNRFANNRLISDYDGDNSSEAWTLQPPGLTNAGGAPCAIPAGDQRLRTAGNTTS